MSAQQCSSPDTHSRAVLEAAAGATLALCLDPRAQPGGEWSDAVDAWRARGGHWAAVQELPGVTWRVGDAEVRALLPGPVDEVPREIGRLQIGGTDLEPDQPGSPSGGPVIWVNAALGMSVGKAAAQVGHASMLYATTHGLGRVPAFRGGVPVRGAGFTEVPPGTITCIAI